MSKIKKLIFCIILVLPFLVFDASAQLYQENYRPQYHFTPEKNWINDPCGMVYLNGEYHLMYQYNPWGTQWGNMSWGHAVSKDLVHWEELPVALFPDELGAIFSGGAVIDHNNTAGFGKGAMVAIYSSAGAEQTQSIGYSQNKGRSWVKYEGNPVLQNQGIVDFRDPMVFWHAETAKWIMALAVKDRIEFYSSPDLINWGFESDFGRQTGAHGGVWECPDLFRLPVEGTEESQWVLMVSLNPGSPSGGSGTQYFLGDFNGSTFTLSAELDALLNPVLHLPEGSLFEDFEGTNYEGWQLSGTAFGNGPVVGTLPGQQIVTGFQGGRLVNSYLKGDAATGTLVSSSFTISHDYINFLIGGGRHSGVAEIRLLIGGEVVAALTGKNEERLLWDSWNVSHYRGSEATIEIIDNATGGWGHLNIDHIYFSNERIENQNMEALWADYGPDFYAGRSWENQPTEKYDRVWLAWMSNWSYAGDLPTSTWRGSMSLPRAMELRVNAHNQVRLFQFPVDELGILRDEHITLPTNDVPSLNQLIQENNVEGKRYELEFTLIPGENTEKAGVELRKGSTGKTIVGFDPALNAVYLDRSKTGRSFSGTYEQVFYAPLEHQYSELKFRVFIDESSVEVFVNEGEYVLSARVFPWKDSSQISFFGSADVEVSSFDFWKMDSIWPQNTVLSVKGDRIPADDLLKVIPNPSNGAFKIRCKEKIESVQLFDLSGRSVALKSHNSLGYEFVSVSEQTVKGIYFLLVHIRNGRVISKKILLE